MSDQVRVDCVVGVARLTIGAKWIEKSQSILLVLVYHYCTDCGWISVQAIRVLLVDGFASDTLVISRSGSRVRPFTTLGTSIILSLSIASNHIGAMAANAARLSKRCRY